jgi:hypothetical protein
LSKIIDLHN